MVCLQFTMISASVKTLFFIGIILALYSDGLCDGLPNFPFRLLSKSNTTTNHFSKGKTISNRAYFRITKENTGDTDRIVGGQYASQDQFPFMVAVHRLMGNGLVSQCGGTIISSRWVLTAGHCVASNPRVFFLLFGVNDKAGMGYNFYNGPGLAMMSNVGIVHPDYQPSVNDIGLIYLPADLPYGENIQPIQLAGSSENGETFEGSVATVIGWGKDGNSGFGTRRLKYTSIPVISNLVCSNFWDITDNHVCTAAGYGQDACQGDSGGPLLVFEAGVPLQIGIVSYGDAYCPSDSPGVFTRVTSYNDWIQETIAYSK